MKIFLSIFFIMTALMFASCAESVNMEHCNQYCSTMGNLNSFGTWMCPVEEEKDAFLACLKWTIIKNDEAGGDDFVKACYKEAAYADVKEGMTFEDAPADKDGVVLPKVPIWKTIRNPKSQDECLNLCEVNTWGYGMPSDFEEDITASNSYVPFLQAQLQEQCRSASSER